VLTARRPPRLDVEECEFKSSDGYRAATIAVCVGLNMLDGFDILAMSFSATGVKAAWQLQDAQLGALLSAGLMGMGLGSLVLGPCADRWGRRRIVLWSVALAALGMLGSAAARGYVDLLVLRVLTGIGIGGTIASAAVVVSECATDRWRSAALAAYATGYPLGATVGGALTALAIPSYGWRSAFVIGGAMSVVLLPIARRGLPESLDFLASRRAPAKPSRVPLELLLTRTTLLVWTAFFCTMAGFYFIVSWTPRLLNTAGLSASQGLTGGVLLNLGGIAGCGLFAIVAARADARRLLCAALIATAVLIAAFGLAMGRLDTALWTALLLGVLANAAMAGLYSVGPPLYPTQIRATGMGWAIGIGRFGAILAPLASGALLDCGWSPAQLYFLFSAPFVVAAVAVMFIKRPIVPFRAASILQ
jgi:MFS family permease